MYPYGLLLSMYQVVGCTWYGKLSSKPTESLPTKYVVELPHSDYS